MDYYVIAWNDALLIGDATIDAQRRRLIEVVASISEKESAADAVLLAEVLDYPATHFAEEESFMERIGYPGLSAHRNEHKTLTRTLFAYKREYDEGKRNLYNTKHFLFRWVRDHIMDEDRKIGLFLATRRQGGGER